jgi:hypothetical protein
MGMSNKKNIISHDSLLSMVSYDRNSGEFFWNESGSGRKEKLGFFTGDGYLAVGIDYRTYRLHRLAWFYVFGVWPNGEIDHINGIKTDNRIDNLRDVSKSINMQNMRSPQKNNKSGFLGVSWSKHHGKYQARIGHKGLDVFLGYFNSPEDAHSAYLKAKRKIHSGCTI